MALAAAQTAVVAAEEAKSVADDDDEDAADKALSVAKALEQSEEDAEAEFGAATGNADSKDTAATAEKRDISKRFLTRRVGSRVGSRVRSGSRGLLFRRSGGSSRVGSTSRVSSF